MHFEMHFLPTLGELEKLNLSHKSKISLQDISCSLSLGLTFTVYEAQCGKDTTNGLLHNPQRWTCCNSTTLPS